MNRIEIDALLAKYKDEDLGSSVDTWDSTQYDDRSARTNYSFVREYKPKVVVEFGSRTGRCTHDILKALYKNGGDFTFRSYEIEDPLRADAQRNLDKVFGKKAIKVGGDITKATDIPDNIDYLFVDNSHDLEITEWLFSTLFKKCKPGCIVMIHDMPLVEDFKVMKDNSFPETNLIVDMHKKGTLPLEKIYWNAEEGAGHESSWWRYAP